MFNTQNQKLLSEEELFVFGLINDKKLTNQFDKILLFFDFINAEDNKSIKLLLTNNTPQEILINSFPLNTNEKDETKKNQSQTIHNFFTFLDKNDLKQLYPSLINLFAKYDFDYGEFIKTYNQYVKQQLTKTTSNKQSQSAQQPTNDYYYHPVNNQPPANLYEHPTDNYDYYNYSYPNTSINPNDETDSLNIDIPPPDDIENFELPSYPPTKRHKTTPESREQLQLSFGTEAQKIWNDNTNSLDNEEKEMVKNFIKHKIFQDNDFMISDYSFLKSIGNDFIDPYYNSLINNFRIMNPNTYQTNGYRDLINNILPNITMTGPNNLMTITDQIAIYEKLSLNTAELQTLKQSIIDKTAIDVIETLTYEPTEPIIGFTTDLHNKQSKSTKLNSDFIDFADKKYPNSPTRALLTKIFTKIKKKEPNKNTVPHEANKLGPNKEHERQ